MRNKYRTRFYSFVFFLCLLTLQTAEASSGPERGFTSWMPATKWEEALLAGNGVMGALVFGRPHDETIILSHAGLYLPASDRVRPIDQASRLDDIRKLMLEGRYAEAAQIPVDQSMEEGYGGQRWSDPFMPAFDIRLFMKPSNIRRYQRSVNYETGEAIVRWRDADGQYERSLFVSRADTVVVLNIKGTGPVSGHIQFTMRHYAWEQRQVVRDNIKDTKIRAEKDWLVYRSEFVRKKEDNPQGYEGAGKLIVTGGSSHVKGESIVFNNADEVLLLVRIEPNDNWDVSNISSIQKKLEKIPSDYEQLLSRQVQVHGELYNRVRFNLDDADDRKLDSEAMVLQAKDSVDLGMIEQIFDAARYNNLCATGLQPPNLQGIWTGVWTPPWASDYTHNGNLPVSISSLLCANLPELMMSYFNYHDRMLPCYRDNTRYLYGSRGIHIPSHTSTCGWDVHFDPTWCMTFWTAGAGWAASFYYDYYLYTGDINFLKNRAYPFMKEAALFYEDFLTESSDGLNLVFNPSYSPENTPKNSNSQACINATMDVMVAKQLLRNCVQAAKILETDQEKVCLWSAMLGKMPAYEINEYGSLREWLWPGLQDNDAHRHVSHLYGLYDRIDPDLASDPELLKAAANVIESRMRIRRRDNGGIMVFGMVQMAFVAANLDDGKTVEELIRWMAGQYWTNSLASTHDPGNLFNMDLSGGFQAAVVRALARGESGHIYILPACPPSWKKGSIDGVLLRGQIDLHKLSWREGALSIKLHSAIEQIVTIDLPAPVSSFQMKGDGEVKQSETDPHQLILSFTGNKTVCLEIILSL